ncbi:hypothetical protein [Nonomuraea glycinis]|uniref:hypothetical protein n=1 Tax=Nonomuraea glycinis TaxID=2047744 RepID=UPI001E2ABDB3|nr:hypothetical protein [Nonomuraea glycinis]
MIVKGAAVAVVTGVKVTVPAAEGAVSTAVMLGGVNSPPCATAVVTLPVPVPFSGVGVPPPDTVRSPPADDVVCPVVSCFAALRAENFHVTVALLPGSTESWTETVAFT